MNWIPELKKVGSIVKKKKELVVLNVLIMDIVFYYKFISK